MKSETEVYCDEPLGTDNLLRFNGINHNINCLLESLGWKEVLIICNSCYIGSGPCGGCGGGEEACGGGDEACDDDGQVSGLIRHFGLMLPLS